jgi:hypothetical protein
MELTDNERNIVAGLLEAAARGPLSSNQQREAGALAERLRGGPAARRADELDGDAIIARQRVEAMSYRNPA